MEAILLAAQFYFLAFVIGLFIAALIKGMIKVIQKITLKKESMTHESVAEEGK